METSQEFASLRSPPPTPTAIRSTTPRVEAVTTIPAFIKIGAAAKSENEMKERKARAVSAEETDSEFEPRGGPALRPGAEGLLTKADRASMGWVLEPRAPFLDRGALDFALGSSLAIANRGCEPRPS